MDMTWFSQPDHPLLRCGLLLFLFSIECFLVFYLLRQKSFWRWLGFFAVFLGLHEMAHLIEVLVLGPGLFDMLCVLFLGGAFLCLGQILLGHVRRQWQVFYRGSGGVLFLVIVCFGIITGGWKMAHFGLSVLIASLAVGWVLGVMPVFVKQDKDPWQRSLLRLTMIFLTLYVMTLVFLVVGEFFSPKMFDPQIFVQKWEGVLQLLRSIILAVAVVMLWVYQARMLKQRIADAVRASFIFWERIFLAALTVILVAGWFFISWVGQKVEAQQKKELLGIAQVVAGSVNPERLHLLKGTIDDLKDPEYTRLREQQLSIARMTDQRGDIRWFYQMVMRDGKIVFTADSILETDPDHSPPGDVYTDAPAGLYDVFRDGKERIIGPYQDRWGVFVSAFVPIKLFDTGQIVGVQGIDVNLTTFMLKSLEIKVIVVSILMLIVILMGGVFIWQIRTHEAEDGLRVAFDHLRAAKEDLERSNELRQQAELQMRDMVESMPNPVFFKDEHGVYRTCNQSFAEYLGLPRESIIGFSVFDVAPKELADRYHQADLEVMAAGGRQHYDGQVAHSSGTMRDVTFYKSVLSYPDGRPRGIVGIILDITERKKIEQDLRDNEARLTRALKDVQSINVRLEKTQDQLLQSEKLAAIGVLAAGVAHEINNPLGFVQSNLSVLSKYVQTFLDLVARHERLKDALDLADKDRLKELGAEIDAAGAKANMAFLKKDVLDLIQETAYGAERIKRIVSGLQHFSYASHGERAAVNVNDVFEGIMNMVVNDLKNRAELVKEYGQVPMIQANAQQLGQVFINIIINAAHAIEHKGIIGLKTYARGDEVVVEVSDNGCGISPEDMKKIFDPFFTTKDPGKGTGLGLSISYDIIRKHKGRIEVESEEGKGTTFRIFLPVSKTV